MTVPHPLVIPWRGRQLRVRHDDPRIGPYSPVGQRIRAAVELATDAEGLRLALASTVGERYRVRVADEGSVVGLWTPRTGQDHRARASGAVACDARTYR